jgi:hypothetical protein
MRDDNTPQFTSPRPRRSRRPGNADVDMASEQGSSQPIQPMRQNTNLPEYDGKRQTYDVPSRDEDVEIASANKDNRPMTRKRKGESSPEVAPARRKNTSGNGKAKATDERSEESAEGEKEEKKARSDKQETSSVTTLELAEALQTSRRLLSESDDQWAQFAQAAEKIGVHPGVGIGVFKTTTEGHMNVIEAYLIPESISKDNLGLENPPAKKRRRRSSPVDPPANKKGETSGRSIISPALKVKAPSTPAVVKERHEELYPLEKVLLTPPKRPPPVNFDAFGVFSVLEEGVAFPPEDGAMVKVETAFATPLKQW